MNEMLTDVNQSHFLLTIRNPRFLIAIYNRSSYRCSHLNSYQVIYTEFDKYVKMELDTGFM
jgi:hypothetical protein